MSIYQYVCEDAKGNDAYHTFTDAAKAKAFGQEHCLRVIEQVYEFSDSEVVWDYTKTEPNEEE